MKKTIIATLLCLACTSGFANGHLLANKTPGEKVDDALDKAKDHVKDAKDKVKEDIDKAKDKIKDGVDEAKDKIDSALDHQKN